MLPFVHTCTVGDALHRRRSCSRMDVCMPALHGPRHIPTDCTNCLSYARITLTIHAVADLMSSLPCWITVHRSHLFSDPGLQWVHSRQS